MKTTLILLAAGNGTRMGTNKLLMRICGKTPVEYCIKAAEKSCVDEIIIAVSEDTRAHAESISCEKPVKCAVGGKTRGESVYNALSVCSEGIVAIHDCARCAVTPDIIDRCIIDAVQYGNSQAAARVRDTIRNETTGARMNRDELLIMQTPQVFRKEEITSAYMHCGTDKNTDDCEVFIAYGGKPHYTICPVTNQKLTYPEDIPFFEKMLKGNDTMRIGYGEDTHRLCEGRDLILGGVKIPFSLGLLGHSDADALCHAVSDALLGACALGDIGKHFPDTDPRYEGADSLVLLSRVAEMLVEKGFRIVNVDATIVAQQPKLAPHIDKMRENISRAINADAACVSVKATTPEHTNAEGRLECMTVRATACVKEVR